MNIPKCSSELKKGLNINEFELAILLNKRSIELMHGAKPLVDEKKNNFIETAILELITGKIKPNVVR